MKKFHFFEMEPPGMERLRLQSVLSLHHVAVGDHDSGQRAVVHLGAVLQAGHGHHLDVAEGLVRAEGNFDGEEGPGVARRGDKLHRPAAVAVLDHGELPHQATVLAIEPVVPVVHAVHLRGFRAGDGDEDLDVVQVELVRGLVLDVHVALRAARRRPAVDDQRHHVLVRGLEAPLEHPQGGVGRERPVGVLEAQHPLRVVQGLVHVGVRLELEAVVAALPGDHPHEGVVWVEHLQTHRALHLQPVRAPVLLQVARHPLLHLDRHRLPRALGGRRGRALGLLGFERVALEALQQRGALLPQLHATRGPGGLARGGGVE
mmetsp:Transcript_29187/g.81652  ORF Transcript_29187/g.81652 Transcript_29187/m.81652 type:complete len:317 (-) Transcript_29187:914-1864(-)